MRKPVGVKDKHGVDICVGDRIECYCPFLVEDPNLKHPYTCERPYYVFRYIIEEDEHFYSVEPGAMRWEIVPELWRSDRCEIVKRRE